MTTAISGELGTVTAAHGSSRELPASVVDVEVSHPLTDLPAHDAGGGRYREAWCLIRIYDEPLGILRLPFSTGRDRLEAARVAAAVRERYGQQVAHRVRDAGGDAESVLAGFGTRLAGDPPFLAAHREWAVAGPEITVAICTHNRPADLARALNSLREQSYRRFRVLVVDNAPPDEATRDLVSSRSSDEWLDYVVEPRQGLSWARNRALSVVATPVIAWLDDDEVADRHWLMELAASYCKNPEISAASGVVVPAELRTWPQLWFEEFGGHSKGRGFVPRLFTGIKEDGQHPLYPLPPFGVGANMSFRVERLCELGGFDTALGAGTLTEGGEDTLMFSQLLLRGFSIAFTPTSMTRHYHRPDYQSLARQMRGYGVGLTAYYASALRWDWRLIGQLVSLIPRAFRDTAFGGEARAVPEGFPRELLWAKSKGMLAGPFLYARARRVAARLAQQ